MDIPILSNKPGSDGTFTENMLIETETSSSRAALISRPGLECIAEIHEFPPVPPQPRWTWEISQNVVQVEGLSRVAGLGVSQNVVQVEGLTQLQGVFVSQNVIQVEGRP